MPADLQVTERPDGDFDVEVRQGAKVTRHRVSVPPGLPERVGAGGADARLVVRCSFEFLLEREPATSILSSFGLDVIPRYFPEYEAELARRLRRSP